MRDRAAIVGIGETEYSTCSGRSEQVLALEAISHALADAGLKAHDIDGVLHFEGDASSTNSLACNLGMPNLRFFGEVGGGGGAGSALVAHAILAVAAGVANYVVCFRALNGRSGRRPGVSAAGARVTGEEAYKAPFGLMSPAHNFAMVVRRHMYEYGTTTRQMGMVAVGCRKHACLNPRAMMYGKPISLEDHQHSRMIVEPFRLLDCCLETDGASAVIVASAERARDLRQRPVYIMGAAQGTGPNPGHNFNRPRLTETPAAYVAAEVYRMAGVTAADIDVAQLYEHFTGMLLITLEDYGFCRKGEGGPFVEGGRIELGGDLPVNTSGGHLSEAYIHGMNLIVEGVRQLRGTSTAQVKDAEVELIASGPGIPGSALILRR